MPREGFWKECVDKADAAKAGRKSILFARVFGKTKILSSFFKDLGKELPHLIQ